MSLNTQPNAVSSVAPQGTMGAGRKRLLRPRTCESSRATSNVLPGCSVVMGSNTLRDEEARGTHPSVGSLHDAITTQSCNSLSDTTLARGKSTLDPGLGDETGLNRNKRKAKDLRIGCLNVTSICQRKEGSQRRQELLDDACRKGLGVVVVVDTRRKGVCDETWTHEATGSKWRFLNSGRSLDAGQSHQGVGFLISPELPCTLVFKAGNSRICGITLTFAEKELKLIGVYAPTKSVEYADFLSELDEFTKLFSGRRDNFAIIGDLNACVGNDVTTYKGLIGAYGENKPVNWKGVQLLEFLEARGLTVLNTHFNHPERKRMTWYSARGEEKSLLDMFLCPLNQRWLWTNVRAYNSIAIHTDHSLVVGTYRYQYKRPSRPKVCEYKVIRTQRLQAKEIATAFQGSVSEDFNSRDRSHFELEDDWRSFCDSILGRAREHCGTRTVKVNSERNSHWWNQSVRVAVEAKRQARKLVTEDPTNENRHSYCLAKREAEKRVEEAKAASWKRFGEKLEQNSKEAPKLFWATIRSLRGKKKETPEAINDKFGKPVTDPKALLGVWRDYFDTLLNPIAADKSENENPERCRISENNDGQVTDDLPEPDEVERAISQLKNGRAPGPDGITAEMLKAMGDEGVLWLTRILRHSYAKGKVVDDWSDSIIVPIFKKGSKKECTN